MDGETGLLTPASDPGALAAAIGRLIADPALRARLGAAGQARITQDFGFAPGIAQLAAKFRQLPTRTPACA